MCFFLSNVEEPPVDREVLLLVLDLLWTGKPCRWFFKIARGQGSPAVGFRIAHGDYITLM